MKNENFKSKRLRIYFEKLLETVLAYQYKKKGIKRRFDKPSDDSYGEIFNVYFLTGMLRLYAF